MNKNQRDMANLFNRLENIRFKLIFMEAAFRGMPKTIIMEEAGISEGISCIFNSIIREQEMVTERLQKIAHSLAHMDENKNLR